MLVAGLYPNLIRADPQSKPTAPPKLLYCSEDGRDEMLQVHEALNSGPWTLDPGPWILDPEPWTLNP